MAITPWNNSSLRRLSNRVSRLEGAFGQLAKAVRYDAHRDATRLYPISEFLRQLRDVRVGCSRLLEGSKRSGRIDAMVASQLSTAYESLDFALIWMGELRTADIGPLSRHPRYAKVREETSRLGESVGLVMKALDQQAEADMEHSSYKIPQILRQAIKRRDSRLVKNLSLTYLDAWVVDFTGMDWQDRKMVDRVAKLFVLDNIPGQTWELRRKSRSPGRPYVLVVETVLLPGPEFLEAQGMPPAEYYIAARLPTWRIVWKMSWYPQN